MNITINNKTFELKQSIRSLLMYENIKGESYFPKNLNDVLLFIYCTVVASSKDYTLDYDTFIDWVDEHPTELEQIVQFIQKTEETQNNIKKNKTQKKVKK